MTDAVLMGTVFDAHTFRGQAFAQAIEALPLFEACVFQPFGTWNVAPAKTPIAIYSAGALGLSDETHCRNLTSIQKAHPGVPVVAMCDTYDQGDIETAVDLGLHAVIPTDFAQDVVLAVFRMVLAGGCYFPFPAAKTDSQKERFKVLSNSDGAPEPEEDDDLDAFEDLVRLTPRQADVLMHLRMGRTNKLIARDLDIAEATVKIYVRQLLRKFEASNRTQIVVKAAGHAGTDTDRSPHMLSCS